MHPSIIAEHVKSNDFNRNRGDVGDVELIKQMCTAVRHHQLWPWASDNVHRKARVGLGQALAHSLIVGDMDVMASRILLDGHFRNYGDTHFRRLPCL